MNFEQYFEILVFSENLSSDSFLFIVLCVFLSIYCLLVFGLFIGVLKVRKAKSRKINEFVSVIVAARNEEQNLPFLLEALKKQTYQNFELIIVNDRSEDRTLEVLQENAKDFHKLKYLTVPFNEKLEMAPKKNALNLGVSKSKGEILLFTDADCIPERDWIEKTLNYFTKEVGFVTGYSPSQGKGFFSLLAELDTLSLACVNAGTIALGFPMTCSGRNLAYRKEVFEEVGGFKKIANFISGDDDLFLHLVRDLTNWKIVFCPESSVLTSPPTSIKAFFNQRIRHASKGKSYTLKTKILLGSVYLFNLLLFLSPILWLLDFINLEPTLKMLFVKTFVEFLVIFWGIQNWKSWKLIPIFPLMELLHIPYVTILGLLGQFLNFEWKEQKFKAKESV